MPGKGWSAALGANPRGLNPCAEERHADLQARAAAIAANTQGPSPTRLYHLLGDDLVPLAPGRLANKHMIEAWIAARPERLGLELLVTGRPVVTGFGGSIDEYPDLRREALDQARWATPNGTRPATTARRGLVGRPLAGPGIGRALVSRSERHVPFGSGSPIAFVRCGKPAARP